MVHELWLHNKIFWHKLQLNVENPLNGTTLLPLTKIGLHVVTAFLKSFLLWFVIFVYRMRISFHKTAIKQWKKGWKNCRRFWFQGPLQNHTIKNVLEYPLGTIHKWRHPRGGGRGVQKMAIWGDFQGLTRVTRGGRG